RADARSASAAARVPRPTDADCQRVASGDARAAASAKRTETGPPTMKITVRVDTEQYAVQIHDLYAHPIVAEIDGRRYEVWLDDTPVVRPAPQPATPGGTPAPQPVRKAAPAPAPAPSAPAPRSEERRVGKEGRARGSASPSRRKKAAQM